VVGDFNGDGRSDVALTGQPGWWTLPVAFSTGAGWNVTNTNITDFAGWSATGARAVPGDFNGDGRTPTAASRWSTARSATSPTGPPPAASG
jgi:hypothetical protein